MCGIHSHASFANVPFYPWCSLLWHSARMRQRQRKLKEDERIEVKRPCPSDPGMIPCFDGKTTASGPALKTNRVFRLRVERAKREVKLLEEERENVCDTDACGYKEPKLASSSSSYILPSPSVAGIPYIPTSSHPPQTCPATVPGRSNKLDLIAALTQSAWTGNLSSPALEYTTMLFTALYTFACSYLAFPAFKTNPGLILFPRQMVSLCFFVQISRRAYMRCSNHLSTCCLPENKKTRAHRQVKTVASISTAANKFLHHCTFGYSVSLLYNCM